MLSYHSCLGIAINILGKQKATPQMLSEILGADAATGESLYLFLIYLFIDSVKLLSLHSVE
jgi:hypothetical protein